MQNILVVDDEEPVRRLLRDCLELDGYEVREAADAMQAIARIGEDIPDCVLLDVMMPGMSGLELLERLRQDPLTATLPVMMLTAATDDDTTWTGWAHGASCYVPKPFDIDHMLDWVSKLCAPPAEEPMDPDVFNIDDLPVSEPAARAEPEAATWFSDPITPPTDPIPHVRPDRAVLRLGCPDAGPDRRACPPHRCARAAPSGRHPRRSARCRRSGSGGTGVDDHVRRPAGRRARARPGDRAVLGRLPTHHRAGHRARSPASRRSPAGLIRSEATSRRRSSCRWPNATAWPAGSTASSCSTRSSR